MRKVMAVLMFFIVLCLLSGCGEKAQSINTEATQEISTENIQETTEEITQAVPAKKELSDIENFLLGKWKCTSVNPKGDDGWTDDASLVGDRTLEFFEDRTAKAVINGEEIIINEWKFRYYDETYLLFETDNFGVIQLFFNTGKITVGRSETNEVADWYSYVGVAEEAE